ncbi:hypothetical protein [Nocardiopsis quinghaiensis]|uniref:hypothetical protein n=1 Tax=Nocardiopsis quinghaiensis TaxID=464995 RepID=UPI002958705A|nr:hypothetical protein [Nocardiopsis quinghaiensis]
MAPTLLALGLTACGGTAEEDTGGGGGDSAGGEFPVSIGSALGTAETEAQELYASIPATGNGAVGAAEDTSFVTDSSINNHLTPRGHRALRAHDRRGRRERRGLTVPMTRVKTHADPPRTGPARAVPMLGAGAAVLAGAVLLSLVTGSRPTPTA